MKKPKVYASFNDLYNDGIKKELDQIKAQHVLNGLIKVNGEWKKIELTDELREKLFRQLSTLYGGTPETHEKIYNRLRFSSPKPQHWGLDRTILSKYDGDKDAYFEYVTGQWCTQEKKDIRNFLKK
jgi:hypothetical protein